MAFMDRYKDLDSPQVKHPPFVVHFAGCQVCSPSLACLPCIPQSLKSFIGQLCTPNHHCVLALQMCTGFHPEKLGECATEFVHSYAEALMRFNSLVAKGAL